MGFPNAQRYPTPATKTCRRGPRFVEDLNLHTHRLREPRFRRGAIPFRSSYRLNKLAEAIQVPKHKPVDKLVGSQGLEP